MQKLKAAAGASLAGIAVSSVMMMGAGTASAASGFAYCYANANNDNGTRLAVVYYTEPADGAWKLVANYQVQTWNGSSYVNASSVQQTTSPIPVENIGKSLACKLVNGAYPYGA